MQNMNVVVLTANLTRDPELRHTNGGTPYCNLGIAVNGSRKDANTGEWVDDPNFFNVTVWGARGERCAEFLKKGSPVAIEGRLDWNASGEGKDRREYVSIVARQVQFLGTKPQKDEASDESSESESAELAGVGASGDEDIPF